MGRGLLLLLALAILAACGQLVSGRSRPMGAADRRDCGFEAGYAAYQALVRTRRSGNQSAWPTRACATPGAADIASACAAREAVPTGLIDRDTGETGYDMPTYQVRGLSCGFTDSGNTEARCGFELALAGAAGGWRRARARFVYRFSLVADPGGHGSYYSSWDADTPCTAP
jgi:hypothetical protein